MKIIYDKENTNFGIYVDRIINTDSYYRKLSNLELNFGTGFDGIRQQEQFLCYFEICF